jgi:hypothetical protein
MGLIPQIVGLQNRPGHHNHPSLQRHAKAAATTWAHAASARWLADSGRLIIGVGDVACSRSPTRTATHAGAGIRPCARGAARRATRSRKEDDAARLGEQWNRCLHRRQPLALAIQPSIHGRNQAQKLIQLHRVGLHLRIVLDTRHGGCCVGCP